MNLSIRQALEASLNNVTGSIDTVWENTIYNPTAGVNYQTCHILGIPDDSVITESTRYEGYLYVRLYFANIGKGVKSISERAMLVATKFRKGSSHNAGGVFCYVRTTPEIKLEGVEKDRFKALIIVRFQTSFIQS